MEKTNVITFYAHNGSMLCRVIEVIAPNMREAAPQVRSLDFAQGDIAMDSHNHVWQYHRDKGWCYMFYDDEAGGFQ